MKEVSKEFDDGLTDHIDYVQKLEKRIEWLEGRIELLKKATYETNEINQIKKENIKLQKITSFLIDKLSDYLEP